LPGNTLKELISNDRIIGGIDNKSSKHAEKVYKKFVKGSLNLTNSKTAEMCKLVENTFRDVNIAYANELSIICEKLNIDVWNLIKLANLHPRVNILNPGPGVGGHCIAVDPWFLISQNKKISKLIHADKKINDLKNKKRKISLSFFGLTYKPNSEDLRESPSLKILKNYINKKNIKTYIVEPNLEKPFLIHNKKLNLTSTKSAILKGDILVFLVKHDEFKHLRKYKKLILQKKVIDICKILDF
jgi:UDP-N-acetyl-D-mannosaminuronic acid dehydrogenase